MRDEVKIRQTTRLLGRILIGKFHETTHITDDYANKLIELGMDSDEAFKTVQNIAISAAKYMNEL